MDVSADAAEILLRETLRAIIRASVFAPNLLETVALSAYLQGALDGRSKELDAALAAREGTTTPIGDPAAPAKEKDNG